MFAKAALRSQAARLVRGDGPAGPWGPMSFAGNNWRKYGALPFSVSKRGKFLFYFWTAAIIGFGLPFANTEWKLAPLREAKRKELAAAKE
ncbi:uncharacterized protein EV422DRAFT_511197 [Fimicolochytrium jonesii]|uniref:uncharacterized protein n=1 Tax=Fimicolochytrium jonesii TaxID=1396493 RepID=UPI0022FEE81A|nr:uncharacterized protein EV422DRAFT_511197 [Fimicolochytrium jonesii]KAI8826728.1 hypothetical protein EV422DRAFT_511197 [Fimicolochytrium jonesii]